MADFARVGIAGWRQGDDATAQSRVGAGGWYQVAAAGGGSPPAGTVTITSVTPSDTTASVAYSYDDTDETGYEYRLDGGTPASIGASPATITGLTSATTYDIEVRAINGDGEGAWSAPEEFTTTAPDTTAPTLTSVGATVQTNTTADIAATTDEANGTMYVVVTTSATPPTATQVRAGQDHTGAAAVFAANQAISSTGAKTFNATGLTTLTGYYGYVHHRDASSNDSDVEATGLFTTFRDGATGQDVVDNTAAVGDIPAGIMFNDVELPADANKWFSYTVVTPVADTDSLTLYPDGSFEWVGTSADSFTYQLEVDGVETGSPQLVELDAVEEGGDETAPILTSPTGAALGANGAVGSVTTDEANGTLYWLTTINATETDAAIKAGSSQAVTTTGVQNVTSGGLTPETLYYIHYLHRDAAGNDSARSTSASFTTPAASSPAPSANSGRKAMRSCMKPAMRNAI